MRRVVSVVTGICVAAVLVACTEDVPAPEEPTGDRVVSDSNGEVRIPANVERIVTLHHSATQPLTDLGVVPVGRGQVDESAVTPETWNSLADVPVVAGQDGPDLEAVAELDPDLIIGHNRLEDTLLNQLRELAPVLVVDLVGAGRADWTGKVDLVARALGKEEELAQLNRTYSYRAEQVAHVHEDVLADETFALVGSWNPGMIRVYGSGSNFGQVFVQAGATIAPAEDEAVADEEEHEAELSQEQAAEVLDASTVLYVTDFAGDPSPDLAAVMETDVFQNLPPVRAGKLHPGGKDTVGGFEDAHHNLDLLDETLRDLADGN